jgi:predicted DNA-binding protein
MKSKRQKDRHKSGKGCFFRLPENIVDQLEELAKKKGLCKAAIVIAAIEREWGREFPRSEG